MLFRCGLILIRIITPRHFLYLPYLNPCLDVDLSMSYLCNLFLILFFIFTDIIFFCLFLEYLQLFLNHNMDEEGE